VKKQGQRKGKTNNRDGEERNRVWLEYRLIFCLFLYSEIVKRLWESRCNSDQDKLAAKIKFSYLFLISLVYEAIFTQANLLCPSCSMVFRWNSPAKALRYDD
jgi:hypothetical protein